MATILFVSHDLTSIAKYCDRVILLNKGVKAGERIVVEGGNKAVPGQPVRIQQASVQDAKLPDQPVGTGSDSGKAE